MCTLLDYSIHSPAIKGVKLQRKHAHLSELPAEEQIKVLDNLGDLYSHVKAFDKALDCYKSEVSTECMA